MAAKLNTFIAQAGALAQRMGIANVVIAARDPDNAEVRVVASPTGLVDLKDEILKKYEVDTAGDLGGADEEVVWPGGG